MVNMISKKEMLCFLAGMACAAIALPFGIMAAVLAPAIIGFAKELHAHFVRGSADPGNLAWMIAGGATFVTFVKLLPVDL